MINCLSGAVHNQKGSMVTVMVQGIGFGVNVPNHYQFTPGATAQLEIYTHVTQDAGMQLFGFLTEDEKAIFMLVISCSGMGPKIGLGLLSELAPAQFVQAILTNDIKTLSSISGIGRKKAESLALQLKDKVEKLMLASATQVPQATIALKNINDALYSLGYSRQEVASAMEFLKESQLLEVSFDEMLRKSLGFLAKRL